MFEYSINLWLMNTRATRILLLSSECPASFAPDAVNFHVNSEIAVHFLHLSQTPL